MKTFMANAQTVERKWYVVDADGMTLGRLASQVAAILRGKHKPTYTPHCDTGDHVIVINACLLYTSMDPWNCAARKGIRFPSCRWERRAASA